MYNRSMTIITAIAIACLAPGCVVVSSSDDSFDGIILNKSSYTLNVRNPIDDSTYAVIRPNEYVEVTVPDERAYTFRAYYGDGALYAVVSFHIDAIREDVEVAQGIYDFAVIFRDVSWSYGRGVEYYP